jgi:hypothetical protein
MSQDPSRESHFPAIEKRYGEKMAYWFKVMSKLEGKKYPEQIAYLKENLRILTSPCQCTCYV